MEEIGFVYSPLDLKILILYVLSLLPEEIDTSMLYDICKRDGVVNYFDFTQSLEELRESGQISDDDGWLTITERGRNNAEALQSSLPYSVRRHAEKAALRESDAMSRQQSITARHRIEKGACILELGLNDGISDVFRLELLCGDEEQAKKMERRFRRNAESTFDKVVSLLNE